MERLGLGNPQHFILNMIIQLNGKNHTLDTSISITSLLESIGLGDKPVVVELNKEALFPREYSTSMLENNDKLEIITIAAGG